jgi:ATP-dependent DNA helicase PIF1
MGDEKQVRDGVKKSTLGTEQRQVYDLIMNGKSVFVTGSAGTGKSYLLGRVIEALPEETTFVTASTGLAAANIGGVTIHSFAGIGLGQGTVEQLLSYIRKRPVYVDRWQNVTHLVIDEVSMLSAELWDKLELIARTLRRNEKPFGGIQLVVCGDFLQLPPVNKSGASQNLFCFLADSWEKCFDVKIELKEIYRQTNQEFVDILNQIRFGQPSASTCDRLKKCLVQSTKSLVDKKNKDDESKGGGKDDGCVLTRLYATNRNVDVENERQLKALSGDAVVFTAKNKGKPGSMDQCAAPVKLHLKIGAQVILLKNLDQEQGLVNGSRGVVDRFELSKKSPGMKVPVVRFANGLVKMIELERWDIKCGDKVVGTRKQIPLQLAWAITIHRSQGMTLDGATIALADCFETGQAFVALSRLKSLDKLHLLSFDPKKIKAHPLAVKYHQNLNTHNNNNNNNNAPKDEVKTQKIAQKRKDNESNITASEKRQKQPNNKHISRSTQEDDESNFLAQFGDLL